MTLYKKKVKYKFLPQFQDILKDYGYESRIIYENACLHITKSLCDNYLGTNNEGILKHGVYHFKGGLGIDEYLIFGDYFFVELLTRLYKDWDSYW